MPKLPVASGYDIVAALQRLGFERRRQSGSHVVMRRGTAGCTVPLHGEIKRGTLTATLRQSEVSVDDLIGALRWPTTAFSRQRAAPRTSTPRSGPRAWTISSGKRWHARIGAYSSRRRGDEATLVRLALRKAAK